MNRVVRRLCLPRVRSFSCVKAPVSIGDGGVYEDVFPGVSTKDIKRLLSKSQQCVYAGFDPTADSLHIGNLLILMNLLHWQRAGHQVIALLGGATGLIGDPSHRESERIQLENDLILSNLKGIERNIHSVFENHAEYFYKDAGPLHKPIFLNNINWYHGIEVLKFINFYGKHFRMGAMLGRTSVQTRLKSESGMSFAEFSYQVFQAYDWLHLFQNYGCSFQIGGNDQMGNIVAGHDLISRVTGKQVYGLTLPLITAEGGKKFGKSLGNAVWLAPEKSSSFQLYQFFVRTKDADVEKYLQLFTFYSDVEIREIVREHFVRPEERGGQKAIAEQVTLLVHGEEGLQAAKKTSAALYNGSIDALSTLSAAELSEAFEGCSYTELIGEFGLTVYDIALRVSCFKSEADAKRIIAAGGFYVNNQRITNENEMVVPGIHIMSNNVTLVRVGKKSYHVVRWV